MNSLPLRVAIFFTFLNGAGISQAEASEVTRQVHDGTSAIRSISLTRTKTVILRNILPGEPLRYTYVLNFPLAEASKVTATLERFLEVTDGTNDEALPTDFGTIGKMQVALIHSGERGDAGYMLRVSEPARWITVADARQFLNCLKLLPEMEREQSKVAAIDVK